MKRTISLLIACGYLTACNSGNIPQSNSSIKFNNPTTPLQKALNKSLRDSNSSISINLYNSIYLSPDNSYTYNIADISGNTINSGHFICNDSSNCIISISLPPNQTYTISILDKENTFIGASSFTPLDGKSYMEVNIDDISTGNYLSQTMTNKLQNPFAIADVENNLFRTAMNYKPNLTPNELVYAYFIYLTKIKGLSTSEAIKYITTEYQNCEAGECKLDDDFIRNDSVINTVLASINQTVATYAQNKNDAELYAAYKWFKESPIPGIINSGINIINQFYPGASDFKLNDKTGAVFNALDVSLSATLSGSRDAYDKAQLFDRNIGAFYTRSPDYLQMINEVTGAILSYQVLNDFNKAYNLISQDYNMANGHLIILNELNNKYEYTPINEYIDHFKKLGNNYDSEVFSWIIKNRDSDVGIWDKTAVKDRANAIALITARNNIDAAALSYRKIFFKDGNIIPTGNIDTIAPRKLYNQALLMDLQKSINTLQYSMYLDNLALIIRDGIVKQEPVSAANFSRMEIVAQINGGIDLTKGDYNIHQMQLKNYYLGKLNDLQQAYKQQILPEKQYVPENVLQTVELNGKCNITYSDGLNILKAKCPVYYGENNVTMVRYINTTLDRSLLKCLTTHVDGSGGLMAIADVRNMSGYLQCLTTKVIDARNISQIGIPSKGNEQSKGNSFFTGSPNYTIRYSKAIGAKEYFDNYVLQNKTFFYLNKEFLASQKGYINYMYLPLPYLVNKDNQDEYYIESGTSLASRPDISYPPAIKDDLVTIKDKYGNIVFSYLKNNAPAEFKSISQIQWGNSTYMNFDAGIMSLYTNEVATKNGNGFYIIATNGDKALKMQLDYETIYTEYPEKTGDVMTAFMPIIEIK